MKHNKDINPLLIKPISLHFGKLIHRNIKMNKMNDWCSTQIDSLKVIFKGECGNKHKSRTCYVRMYNNDQTTPKLFLRTTFKKYICSIDVIYQSTQYFILVSGNSDLLNIFIYDPRNSSQFIGKIVLCSTNYYQTQSNHSD